MKSSIVKDKSYAFALRTVTLARWLKRQKEFEIAGQILRSGTAIVKTSRATSVNSKFKTNN